MNELIKELADRLWRVSPNDIDAMGLKTRTEFYEHELKKFAELIVQECLEIVNRHEYSYHEADPLWETAQLIKERFGVEE